MKLLIAFPIIAIMGAGVQVATERVTHEAAMREALEACYDAPDTTDEECEAWDDSGYVWPGVRE